MSDDRTCHVCDEVTSDRFCSLCGCDAEGNLRTDLERITLERTVRVLVAAWDDDDEDLVEAFENARRALRDLDGP